MKISWNWLAENGSIWRGSTRAGGPSTDHGRPGGQGHRAFGRRADDVVVCDIDAIEEHPKADRLVVCHVARGSGGHPRQIVCGATNMSEGDLGCRWRCRAASCPRSTSRSAPARCAEWSPGDAVRGEELGLEDGVDGLMILPEGLELGQPVFEALGLVDVIYRPGSDAEPAGLSEPPRGGPRDRGDLRARAARPAGAPLRSDLVARAAAGAGALAIAAGEAEARRSPDEARVARCDEDRGSAARATYLLSWRIWGGAEPHRGSRVDSPRWGCAASIISWTSRTSS